jgi:hypothetical protein
MAGVVRKVVGMAVAQKKGHYPMPDGRIRKIELGEVFQVLDGLTKSRWFTLLKDTKDRQPGERVPVQTEQDDGQRPPGAGPKPGSADPVADG